MAGSGSKKRGLIGRRPTDVWLGASLFLGGAVVTVSAMLLPHPPEADEIGYFAMALAQTCLAVLLLAAPRTRVDRALPEFVTLTGMLIVTASVYFNGERLGGPTLLNEFFYVWPALYAGYFFGRRELLGALSFMAIAYAGVLHFINVPVQFGITRWSVGVTCVWGLAFAAHVLRLQRNRLVERLRQAVRTDPLTTVLNRRGFDESIERELERVARQGEPVAIVVGDLDRFKALNDRFGHGAGDEALAAVGGRLKAELRTIDTVARIGGEEFALLLPSTDEGGAFEAAERLRAAVSTIADPDGRPLTISFGVVVCDDARAGADRLLAAADAALYRAKAAGRDRTEVADPVRVLAAA